jgi:hypothetical protein
MQGETIDNKPELVRRFILHAPLYLLYHSLMMHPSPGMDAAHKQYQKLVLDPYMIEI